MALDDLSPAHRDMLEKGSGIRTDIIDLRGYRTVSTAASLKRLGFSESQRLVPALLLPIINVYGDTVLYQTRPDRPRVMRGKLVKYETPRGSSMAVDCHPSMRHLLRDPDAPLWITEGIKKGDCLVSRECVTLSLLGVWNFRGTNESGGKMILPDWEGVALNTRRIYITFDSDVMVKAEVHDALSRLKAFLEQREADVQVIYLPCGDGGAKCGVDDFLVSGRSIDDLVKLATPTLRPPLSHHGESSLHPYRKTSHGIVVAKRGRDGEEGTMTLSNFTAEIVAERRIDNGAESSREYDIEATVGDVITRCRVPVGDFSNLQWVPQQLGARAILPAGRTLQDALRQAIQCLSKDIETIDEYAHTGWRQIKGQSVYLHGGGAIGRQGPIPAIDVKLSPKLSRYTLTMAASAETLRQAIECSVELLAITPGGQMIPLLAASFLAPLSELLGAHRPDFVLALQGPTGAHKTELAALAQSHYGPCDRLHLPASFKDTPATIEKVLFEAKDALVVVDDLHPAQNPAEANRMNEIYATLMRGVGNGRMRGRMRSDMTARPDYPPRAVVITTVERAIDGHSNASRQLPVLLPLGAVDLARLTRAQAHRALYQHGMAAYVQGIADRLDQLRETLPEQFLMYQNTAQALRGHARNPGQVAHLMLGFDGFIELAVAHHVITADEGRSWRKEAWRYFLGLAHQHGQVLQAESVVERFRALLADGFASRAAYLESKTGGPPDDAEAWGWQVSYSRNSHTGEEDRHVRSAQNAKLLGRIDHLWIYLFPEATYQYLTTAARSAGQVFPVDLSTLTLRLDEARLIDIEVEKEGVRRRQVRVSIEGRKHRVIKLKRQTLDPTEDQREPLGTEVGTPEGTEATEEQERRPIVPKVPRVPTPNDNAVPIDQEQEREAYARCSMYGDFHDEGRELREPREPIIVDLREET
jgi:hypothetical protein